MPSDSAFAVAMRSQQEAERAEQQRIKNLVLNYDLTNDQEDGESPSFHYVQASDKTVRLVGTGSLNKRGPQQNGRLQHTTFSGGDERIGAPSPEAKQQIIRQDSFTDVTGAFESLHNGPRYDKSGNTRSKQRARKLQLGDIDWYGRSAPACSVASERHEGQHSLDEYVVDSKSKRGRRSGACPTRDRAHKQPHAAQG